MSLNKPEDDFLTFKSINCIFEKYDEVFNSVYFDIVRIMWSRGVTLGLCKYWSTGKKLSFLNH